MTERTLTCIFIKIPSQVRQADYNKNKNEKLSTS